MAVDLWNEITVERSASFSITTMGEGAGLIPDVVSEAGESNHLVLQALQRAFEYAGETPMPPVTVTCKNKVPISSGFGSSSAAIIGGLLAGLVLAGKELNVEGGSGIPEELLQLANEIEGHADNVAPALYGGIQLCCRLEGDSVQKVMSRRLPCPPGMRLVVYVPTEDARFNIGADKTTAMRELLKPEVSRDDAVFNIQRTALMVDALHRQDLTYLRTATQDKLHQPIRGEKAFPHMRPMIDAALGAGAHGAFLSGAGPSIMAICSGARGDIFAQRTVERQELLVAGAMREAVMALSPEHVSHWAGGEFFITGPTVNGAHVVSATPSFSTGLETFGSLDGSL
uniref:Homoserine kinase n=1 Tax=Octactis speculum TaxID=3111310 RepID=A0A7S2GR82_9STRA